MHGNRRHHKTSHPSDPTFWTAGAGWLAPWNCWKAGCCKTTCRGAFWWITSSIISRRKFSASNWMEERDSLRVSEAKEASLSSERAEVPACACVCYCICIWIDQCQVQKFKPRRYEVRIVVKCKSPNSCILLQVDVQNWFEVHPCVTCFRCMQELQRSRDTVEQLKVKNKEQISWVSSQEEALHWPPGDQKSCDWQWFDQLSIAEWWMKWHFQILSWRGSFNQPNGSCKKFVQDEVRRFVWLNGRSCRGAKMWSSNWSLTHLTSQQWCSANSRTQTWLTLKIYFQIWTHATYDIYIYTYTYVYLIYFMY